MPSMDSGSKAALTSGFAPAWIIWLDVVGDPVRVTSFGADTAFASTGDSDLDGKTFKSFAGEFLDVSDVTNSDGGSDTVTVTLSGILSLDQTLLNAIGDTTKWQGRTCRIWFQLYDPTGTTAQGAVVAHYTGYMSSVSIIPSRDTQTIQLTVENYLVAFNQASNRSWLNQSTYDAADTSAAATIAAANAARHVGGGSSSTYQGGSTGAGGSGGGGQTDYGGQMHYY